MPSTEAEIRTDANKHERHLLVTGKVTTHHSVPLVMSSLTTKESNDGMAPLHTAPPLVRVWRERPLHSARLSQHEKLDIPPVIDAAMLSLSQLGAASTNQDQEEKPLSAVQASSALIRRLQSAHPAPRFLRLQELPQAPPRFWNRANEPPLHPATLKSLHRLRALAASDASLPVSHWQSMSQGLDHATSITTSDSPSLPAQSLALQKSRRPRTAGLKSIDKQEWRLLKGHLFDQTQWRAVLEEAQASQREAPEQKQILVDGTGLAVGEHDHTTTASASTDKLPRIVSAKRRQKNENELANTVTTVPALHDPRVGKGWRSEFHPSTWTVERTPKRLFEGGPLRKVEEATLSPTESKANSTLRVASAAPSSRIRSAKVHFLQTEHKESVRAPSAFKKEAHALADKLATRFQAQALAKQFPVIGSINVLRSADSRGGIFLSSDDFKVDTDFDVTMPDNVPLPFELPHWKRNTERQLLRLKRPLETLSERPEEQSFRFPIECFDNHDMETVDPELLIQSARERGELGAAAYSRYYRNKDNLSEWDWAPCTALEYNASTELFHIVWTDTKVHKWVPRLNIFFEAENRDLFYKRLEAATEYRALYDREQSYLHKIDGLSIEGIAPLTPDLLQNMVRRVTHSKALNEVSPDYVLKWFKSNSERTSRVLHQCLFEVEMDYLFANKKAHHEQTQRDSIEEAQQVKRRIAQQTKQFAIKAVEKAKEEDPVRAFQLANKIVTVSRDLSAFMFLANSHAQRGTLAAVATLQQTMQGDSFFENLRDFPCSFYNFEEKVNSHAALIQSKLSITWPKTVQTIIQEQLSTFFDLHPPTAKAFDASRLKKYLTLLNLVMETQLKNFVITAMKQFLALARIQVDVTESGLADTARSSQFSLMSVSVETEETNHGLKVQNPLSQSASRLVYTVKAPMSLSLTIPTLFYVTIGLVSRDDHFQSATGADTPLAAAQIIVLKPTLISLEHALLNMFRKPIEFTHASIPVMQNVMFPAMPLPQEFLKTVQEEEEDLIRQGDMALLATLRSSYEEVRSLVAQYKSFEFLLQSNPAEEKKLNVNSSVDAFRQDLSTFAKAAKRVREISSEQVTVPPLVVDCLRIRLALIKCAEDGLHYLTEILRSKLFSNCQQLNEAYEKIHLGISIHPLDTNEWKKLSQHLETCPLETNVLEPTLLDAEKIWSMFEENDLTVDDESSRLYWSVYKWPSQIETEFELAWITLKEAKEHLIQQLDIERHYAQQSVEAYVRELAEFETVDDVNRTAEMSEKVQSLRQRFDRIDLLIVAIGEKEVSLGLEKTPFHLVVTFRQPFKECEQLWLLSGQVHVQYPKWMSTYFAELDAIQMKQTVDQWLLHLQEMQHQRPQSKTVHHLRHQLEIFSLLIPMLIDLRNPALRESHWQTLHQRIGLSQELTHSLTVSQVIEMELDLQRELINNVSRIATDDFLVDRTLDEMLTEFRKLELPYERLFDMDKDFYRLCKVTDLVKIIESQQQRLYPLTCMHKAERFMEKLSGWNGKLMRLKEALASWIILQKNYVQIWCLYKYCLLPSDFKEQVEALLPDIIIAQKTLRALSDNLSKNTSAIWLIRRTDMFDSIIESSHRLERVKSALSKNLDSLRQQYGLLSFLENEIIFSLAAKGAQLQTLEQDIWRYLPSIRRLSLIADNTALRELEWTVNQAEPAIQDYLKSKNNINNETGFYVAAVSSVTSLNGECLTLFLPVLAGRDTFDLLTRLDMAIRANLRQLFRQAWTICLESPLHEWILRWPHQISQLVYQVAWTIDVENIYQGKQSYRESRKKWSKDQENLMKLVKTLEWGSLQRRQVQWALTALNEGLEFMDNFLAGQQKPMMDTEWLNTLRYYVNAQTHQVTLQLGSVTLQYAFELLPTSPLWIMPPIARQNVQVLAEIIKQFSTATLFGQPDMGKSTNVQLLATLCGRQVRWLTCSSKLDFQFLRQQLLGTLRTGQWLCLNLTEELNSSFLIPLSSLYQSLQRSVAVATKTRSKVVRFKEMEYPFYGDWAVFQTWPYCALIPFQSTLIKPVAVIYHDAALICEQWLLMQGCKGARPLSKKLVALLENVSMMLHQPHWHSMRLALEMVQAMSQNRIMATEEALTFMAQFTMDWLSGMISWQQRISLERWIETVFGVTLNESSLLDQIEEQVMIEAFDQLSLSFTEPMAERVLQIMQSVRRKKITFLVGAPVTGKSTCCRVAHHLLKTGIVRIEWHQWKSHLEEFSAPSTALTCFQLDSLIGCSDIMGYLSQFSQSTLFHKLIIELESLDELPPLVTTLGCGVVHFDETKMDMESIVRSKMMSLPEPVRAHLHYIRAFIDYIAKKFYKTCFGGAVVHTTIIPILDLFRMFQGLYDSLTSNHFERMTVAEQETWILCNLYFCLVCSLSHNVQNMEQSSLFDETLRNLVTPKALSRIDMKISPLSVQQRWIPLPEQGHIQDYFFSPTLLIWLPWEQWQPQLELPRGIVASKDFIRLTFWCFTWKQSSILVLGDSGTGKSVTAQAALHCLKQLLPRLEVKKGLDSKQSHSFGAPCRILVDDLNDSSPLVLDQLRQELEANGLFDASYVLLSEQTLSPRLLRHFLVYRLEQSESQSVNLGLQSATLSLPLLKVWPLQLTELFHRLRSYYLPKEEAPWLQASVKHWVQIFQSTLQWTDGSGITSTSANALMPRKLAAAGTESTDHFMGLLQYRLQRLLLDSLSNGQTMEEVMKQVQRLFKNKRDLIKEYYRYKRVKLASSGEQIIAQSMTAKDRQLLLQIIRVSVPLFQEQTFYNLTLRLHNALLLGHVILLQENSDRHDTLLQLVQSLESIQVFSLDASSFTETGWQNLLERVLERVHEEMTDAVIHFYGVMNDCLLKKMNRLLNDCDPSLHFVFSISPLDKSLICSLHQYCPRIWKDCVALYVNDHAFDADAVMMHLAEAVQTACLGQGVVVNENELQNVILFLEQLLERHLSPFNTSQWVSHFVESFARLFAQQSQPIHHSLQLYQQTLIVMDTCTEHITSLKDRMDQQRRQLDQSTQRANDLMQQVDAMQQQALLLQRTVDQSMQLCEQEQNHCEAMRLQWKKESHQLNHTYEASVQAVIQAQPLAKPVTRQNKALALLQGALQAILGSIMTESSSRVSHLLASPSLLISWLTQFDYKKSSNSAIDLDYFVHHADFRRADMTVSGDVFLTTVYDWVLTVHKTLQTWPVLQHHYQQLSHFDQQLAQSRAHLLRDQNLYQDHAHHTQQLLHSFDLIVQEKQQLSQELEQRETQYLSAHKDHQILIQMQHRLQVARLKWLREQENIVGECAVSSAVTCLMQQWNEEDWLKWRQMAQQCGLKCHDKGQFPSVSIPSPISYSEILDPWFHWMLQHGKEATLVHDTQGYLYFHLWEKKHFNALNALVLHDQQVDYFNAFMKALEQSNKLIFLFLSESTLSNTCKMILTAIGTRVPFVTVQGQVLVLGQSLRLAVVMRECPPVEDLPRSIYLLKCEVKDALLEQTILKEIAQFLPLKDDAALEQIKQEVLALDRKCHELEEQVLSQGLMMNLAESNSILTLARQWAEHEPLMQSLFQQRQALLAQQESLLVPLQPWNQLSCSLTRLYQCLIRLKQCHSSFSISLPLFMYHLRHFIQDFQQAALLSPDRFQQEFTLRVLNEWCPMCRDHEYLALVVLSQLETGVDRRYFEFLFQGSVEMPVENVEQTVITLDEQLLAINSLIPNNPASTWLDRKQWEMLYSLNVFSRFQKLVTEFPRLANRASTVEEWSWEEYASSKDAEWGHFPGDYSLTPLEKVMIIKCLRPDLLQKSVQVLLLPKEMPIKPNLVSWIQNHLSSTTPILFLLVNDMNDPGLLLRRLQEKQGRSNALQVIDAQDSISLEQFQEWKQKGKWIYMMHCEQYTETMKKALNLTGLNLFMSAALDRVSLPCSVVEQFQRYLISVQDGLSPLTEWLEEEEPGSMESQSASHHQQETYQNNVVFRQATTKLIEFYQIWHQQVTLMTNQTSQSNLLSWHEFVTCLSRLKELIPHVRHLFKQEEVTEEEGSKSSNSTNTNSKQIEIIYDCWLNVLDSIFACKLSDPMERRLFHTLWIEIMEELNTIVHDQINGSNNINGYPTTSNVVITNNLVNSNVAVSHKLNDWQLQFATMEMISAIYCMNPSRNPVKNRDTCNSFVKQWCQLILSKFESMANHPILETLHNSNNGNGNNSNSSNSNYNSYSSNKKISSNQAIHSKGNASTLSFLSKSALFSQVDMDKNNNFQSLSSGLFNDSLKLQASQVLEPHHLMVDHFYYWNYQYYRTILDRIVEDCNNLIQQLTLNNLLSNEMRLLFDALLQNKVPFRWMNEKGLNTMNLPLNRWLIQLKSKLDYANDWAESFTKQQRDWPAMHDLSKVYDSESLLLAFLHDHAKTAKEPLEHLEWEATLLASKQNIPPPRGYYVTGVWLRGAVWDFQRTALRECRPMEHLQRLPCIWLQPTVNTTKQQAWSSFPRSLLSKSNTNNNNSGLNNPNLAKDKRNKYKCPLYVRDIQAALSNPDYVQGPWMEQWEPAWTPMKWIPMMIPLTSEVPVKSWLKKKVVLLIP